MELAKSIITNKDANVRVYFIKKTRGKGAHSAVIFPNAINTSIKASYRENFVHFTDSKEVREYDGVHHETETIQTVPLVELMEWERIKSAIETAESTNKILDKQSFNDDYTLLIVVFELNFDDSIRQIYLVAKYRKIDTWYKRSIKYAFTGGILKEVNREIFILNGCIDAAISNGNMYILMPKNFESIFNYYKKAEETLNANKNYIEGWFFLDNPRKFYNCIQGKKGATLKIVRALQKSSMLLNKLTPQEVKNTLTAYNKFKDIQYDKNDKIIVTERTRDLIIDILRDVYAKNLFTDELIRTKGV
ncbi:MAG: DUF4868 domain-containing protein [Spirochaetaceae bacterium]|jgi:hypothetical protein|nr:DUF4868 domain-containing protein [Spirochaetaceae bacterium]